MAQSRWARILVALVAVLLVLTVVWTAVRLQ